MLLFTQISKAQLYVRAYNFRPTGDYGYVFKPGFSAEIGYMPEFESRVRFTFSGSYMMMKPRQTAIPIYAVQSGNGTVILPGEQSFKKYNILQITGGIDVAIVKREKFFAYVGTDIIVGAGAVDYQENVPTFKTEGYSGGGYLGGGRFRLGLQYDVTYNIGIIAHANRSVFLISEPATINWLNDYGIGIRYQFD